MHSMTWKTFPEGMQPLGYAGNEFCFDNELPRHQIFQPAFRLANRLVTGGEYLEFMSDGGYRRPELWLSDGWAGIQERGTKAPVLPWEFDRLDPATLGDYALELGDGYEIHGTLYPSLLGRHITHGCVRLNDADLEAVFAALFGCCC